MIKLKVTKKQVFTRSLEDNLFKKPQGLKWTNPPTHPAPSAVSRFRVKSVFDASVNVSIPVVSFRSAFV